MRRLNNKDAKTVEKRYFEAAPYDRCLRAQFLHDGAVQPRAEQLRHAELPEPQGRGSRFAGGRRSPQDDLRRPPPPRPRCPRQCHHHPCAVCGGADHPQYPRK